MEMLRGCQMQHFHPLCLAQAHCTLWMKLNVTCDIKGTMWRGIKMHSSRTNSNSTCTVTWSVYDQVRDYFMISHDGFDIQVKISWPLLDWHHQVHTEITHYCMGTHFLGFHSFKMRTDGEMSCYWNALTIWKTFTALQTLSSFSWSKWPNFKGCQAVWPFAHLQSFIYTATLFSAQKI